MKSYRNAIAALVLTFVFSMSTFAGDGVLHTDKTPPPPPPPQTESVIGTGAASSEPEEEDTLTEITLSLLQTLVSLL